MIDKFFYTACNHLMKQKKKSFQDYISQIIEEIHLIREEYRIMARLELIRKLKKILKKRVRLETVEEKLQISLTV